MNQRQTKIFNELVDKCINKKTTEFDYFVEIWGLMWYPWFIEINGENQTFKHNDISSEDLKLFCEIELIELIKTYTKDDIDHNLYRIKKTAGNSSYTKCKGLVELPFGIELFT